MHRIDDAVEIRSLLHLRQTTVEERTQIINNARNGVILILEHKLTAWGMKLQKKKKGNRKAIVAVARKLAVLMHKMLVTRKPFERTPLKKEGVAA